MASLVALPVAAKQDTQGTGSEAQRNARDGARRGEQLVPDRVYDRARQRESTRGIRMSPEERRQLRRDINQHSRDLYRNRREKRKQ
ncbi:MAG: hypothetical protein A3G25_16405 [Betaproteobacteria bacterium RIFCSPLOWO2_12_FULL_63_13]|nr:MAG: hypothetical protein A3G25_16405 [Betaproteobacteria bacterium RIFCSPLOWO2_12_FULL_63_13]